MPFKSRKQGGCYMEQGTEVQCKAICVSALARSVLELHPTDTAWPAFSQRCLWVGGRQKNAAEWKRGFLFGSSCSSLELSYSEQTACVYVGTRSCGAC